MSTTTSMDEENRSAKPNQAIGIRDLQEKGESRTEYMRNNLTKITTSNHVYSVIANIMNVDADDEPTTSEKNESRTELDSHANMPVVGCNCYIISNTGKIADVNPFTPDYPSIQVPIVDAAVQYNCPYDGKTYVYSY